MKISKSKRQLARLLIEAGVKKFPDGAEWAAQDKDDKTVYMHKNKPMLLSGCGHFSHRYTARCRSWVLPELIHNWHRTALSRAEFDQIVAEVVEQSKPDADGWIEWGGGECPVDGSALVEVKLRNPPAGNIERIRKADEFCWKSGFGGGGEIISYRLHKPEQTEPQYCESVARTIPEPVTAPTLDQLLQDYRNAIDFAAAKQAEADEAAKMRDERWKAVQARACDLDVRIIAGLAVDAEMRESEPVITDWRDLRVGDLIKVTGFSGVSETERRTELLNADSCTVVVAEGDDVQIEVTHNSSKCSRGWSLHGFVDTQWRFIRRP